MQYILGIMMVIIGVLGFQNYMYDKEEDALHTKEGAYETQIKELQGSLRIKDAEIVKVNALIDGLHIEGEKRAQQAAAAQEKARQASKVNQSLAQALLSRTGDPKLDYCLNTSALFNEYLDIRKKRNEVPSH
jgi:hypothetical protein